MNSVMSYIIQANKLVFKRQKYIILTVIFFVVFFVLYAFILPATYTGGRIGLVSLRLITPNLVLFTFLFSVLLAPAMSFAVYAFRKKQTAQSTSSAAGGFVGSILPPLLCCSPLLPSLAALIGGTIPFAFGVSGFIQGFMATYETEIFIAVTIVLIYSLYQNAKQVVWAEQGICSTRISKKKKS